MYLCTNNSGALTQLILILWHPSKKILMTPTLDFRRIFFFDSWQDHDFSLLQRIHTGFWGAHPAIYLRGTGGCFQEVKRPVPEGDHTHLLPRLRMNGGGPPLIHSFDLTLYYFLQTNSWSQHAMTLFFLIPDNSSLSQRSTARHSALFSKYWFRFPTFFSAIMTELITAVK